MFWWHLSVCLSVCMITFERLDVGSSLLVSRNISDIFRDTGQVCMKIIGSRARLQQQQARNSLFPRCETAIGNDSGLRSAWPICRIFLLW